MSKSLLLLLSLLWCPMVFAGQAVTGNLTVTGNTGIGTTLVATSGLTVMSGNVGIGTWKPAQALDVVGTARLSTMTQGSVPYIGANGVISQNNATLYFSGSQFGVGTNTPDQKFTVAGGNMDLYPVFGSNSTASSGSPAVGSKIQGQYFYLTIQAGASSGLRNNLVSPFGLLSGSSLVNANLANSKDLDVQGNVCAVISNTGGTSVLSLFNVTNPAVMTLYSNMSETVNIVNGLQVFIQGNYLFVNNDNNTVSSYDISNKFSPRFLQKLAYNTGTGGSFLTSNTSIGRLIGNYMYFANANTAGDVDFAVVNVSNPRAMVVTRITDIATGTNFSSSSLLVDLAVNNGAIYTLDATNGIVVYSLPRNTADIAYQSNTTTNISTPSKMIAHGYYVYVLDSTQQKIYLYSSEVFTVTYQTLQTLNFSFDYFDVSNAFISLSSLTSNRYAIGALNQIYTPTISAGDTNFGNLYVTSNTQLENKLTVLGGANFAAPVNFSMPINIDTSGTALTLPFGNVGIGTFLPGGQLNVNGRVGIGTANSAYVSTAAPAGGLAVEGNVGIGTWLAANNLTVNGRMSIGTANSAYVTIAAPAGGQIIEGNLGIGTFAPLSTLDVRGNVRVASGSSSAPAVINTGDGSTGMYWPINGELGFSSNSVERIRIDGNGNVGIGSTVPSGTMVVSGHIHGHNTAPVVSTCGTSPTIVGSDLAGKVTTGAGIFTACTITFATAWKNAPSCWVDNETTVALTTNGTSTTTTLTINGSAAITANTIAYGCIGWE